MSINFETFEEEHGADLKKYIRSKMLGADEVQDHDDVWQELIVQLLQRDMRDDLPDIRDAKNYAFFVLKNIINKYISDKLNREALFISTDEVLWNDGSAYQSLREWQRELDPEAQAIYNEAIENLSAPASQAFESIRQGLTVAEQAETFGTSERTADRNRARLRDELQEVAV